VALKIKQKFISSVTKRLPWLPKKAILPLAAAIVLVPALTVLAFSYGPLVNVEPENGSLSGGAASVLDGSASGGESVKFQTPGACPNAPHTPGGDDGQGGCWPYEGNTGIPSGTGLTNYSGPMTVTTDGTIIDAKTITGTLVISAENVTIRNSKVNGNIDADAANVSVIIEDSEIDGGNVWTPAVGYGDITMKRTNVHGSRVSVLCGDNCDIQDSYLHGQYLQPGTDWHVNGYVSNGGSNVLVQHNSLACEVNDNANGGGCTGPAASFGDFAPITNVTYNHNLLVATPGAYCLYAGYDTGKPFGSNPTNVAITNNVFQRGPGNDCAAWGPASSFLNANGNVWSNNVWDNGGTVPAP